MDFYEIINDVRYHVKHNKSLFGKHEEFKKNYSKLFAMLCDPDCDQEMLNKLISLHKKVNKGKLSQNDADCEFGKVAADKYVSPLVEKNSKDASSQVAEETKEHTDWTHV